MLRTQTHIYVLYMQVIMHTEGLTCNRLQTMTISNYALTSLIFIVYCQSYKARLAHTSKNLCYLSRLLCT